MRNTVSVLCGDSPEACLFWNRALVIDYIFGPLEKCRKWGGGCHCHEKLLRHGRSVQCPLKGRRATEALDRVEVLTHEIDDMMLGLDPSTMFWSRAVF